MKQFLSTIMIFSLLGVFAMANSEKPAIDIDVPSTLEKATFGLGCFWGSEAAFGGTRGIYKTSVGYAGGTKENPSYFLLGDHTEVVQIEFDPSEITYEALLEVFWSSHNAYIDYKRQYMSIILYHNADQRDVAEEFIALKESERDMKSATEISQIVEFYRAEDYHLKFYLQRDRGLLNDLLGFYGDIFELDSSTAAARLNSLLAGKGDRDLMRAEYISYGLQEGNLQKVSIMLE